VQELRWTPRLSRASLSDRSPTVIEGPTHPTETGRREARLPEAIRRRQYRGSSEHGQRKEERGDGAAYGHARCAPGPGDRDQRRVWTAGPPAYRCGQQPSIEGAFGTERSQRRLGQGENRRYDDENSCCHQQREPAGGEGDTPNTQQRRVGRAVPATPGDRLSGGTRRDLRRRLVRLRYAPPSGSRPIDHRHDRRQIDLRHKGGCDDSWGNASGGNASGGNASGGNDSGGNNSGERGGLLRIDRRRCVWRRPLGLLGRGFRSRRPLGFRRLPRSMMNLGVRG